MSAPHIVVKRGHLGRYRFALLTEGGRLTGEVRVEVDGASRADQDAAALSQIRRLAAALVTATNADTLA